MRWFPTIMEADEQGKGTGRDEHRGSTVWAGDRNSLPR